MKNHQLNGDSFFYKAKFIYITEGDRDMIYELITKLITPLEALKKPKEEPALESMFDHYQNLSPEYVPNNRVDKEYKPREPKSMRGRNTPYIDVNLVNEQDVYKCYITDPIGFNISGNVYEDSGTEVDLATYLNGKKLKLSLFNFWGDLVASKVFDAAENAFTIAPAIFAGVYRGIVELLDVNNVVLAKLFGMNDALFAIDSYIANATATDIYVNTLPIEIVTELPAEGTEGILYLLTSGNPTDPYIEYLYVNGVWNKLGVLDYEDLENIPTINGVQVIGDKNAPEYDLEYDMDDITYAQIDDIVS